MKIHQVIRNAGTCFEQVLYTGDYTSCKLFWMKAEKKASLVIIELKSCQDADGRQTKGNGAE